MKPPKVYKRNILSPTALLLPFEKGHRWINLDEIIRLEGIGNYTSCIFADGSALLVALTIRRLQDRIPAGLFVRPHKKHLLNRAYVAGVHPNMGAVSLTNGDRVAMARRRAIAFRQDMKA
ncbi:MAG: LytTR family transcriptional regulator [Spirosoma sp.]|nr:LytTR family transcriptional regulator [Spirosoma sp.]